jgi:formylglycine-generating enzyme required for sulfatase activity
LDDSDTFIGILWNRFGTPTGKAQAGTEEEFDVAYQQWEKKGRPRIHFYFCQRPANLTTTDDLRQKAKVLKFRKRVNKLGLVTEYEALRDFEVAVRNAIIADLLDNKEILVRPSVNHQSTISARATGTAEMVLIAAGQFAWGPDQSPRVIPYDYFIDTTPVTNAQYAEFVDQTGYLHHQGDPSARLRLERLYERRDKYPDHPVTEVSWYDANACAAWMGKRLPTADEWEKAARGVDGFLYPWGNEFLPDRCNSKESGLETTTPVRKYESGRSPFGVYDMAGNVFEWVLDWTEDPRFSTIPEAEKLNRGGSFNRNAEHLTCWYVESDPPNNQMLDVGFRCARIAMPHDLSHASTGFVSGPNR